MESKSLIEKIKNDIYQEKVQKMLIMIIVCTIFLLDNLLCLVIVPIVPFYLKDFKMQQMESSSTHDNSSSSQPSTSQHLDIWESTPPSPTSQNNTTNNSTYFNETLIISNDTKDGKDNFLAARPIVNHTDPKIGILFIAKPIVQILIGPIAGTITDKIGYEIPMAVGLLVIFISTTIFAFGRTYVLLLTARSIQGIGSGLADIAGFAILADVFDEATERSQAQGIAVAFISIGCMIAPFFGGLFYEYCGRSVPFLIISFLALLACLMMIFIKKPDRDKVTDFADKSKKATPIYRLILDHYVAICAGALIVSSASWAFVQPTLTRWMNETMNADEFQTGIVWLPSFIFYILGVYITTKLVKIYPKYQWLIVGFGIFISGISCLALPFCKQVVIVTIPLILSSFGSALVDTSVLPMMAYLIDTRHVPLYGSVYAITDMSYAIAYASGPIIADILYQTVGFLWLNVVVFCLSFLYAPFLIIVRNAYRTNLGYEDVESIKE